MVAEYNNDSQQQGSGSTFVTADSLGSPRLLTTSQAVVKARHDYAPFGEELTPQLGGRSTQQQYVSDNLRQKFTGQERDIESGLDYFHARYFASKQGRFTSPDPLQASGTTANPQTWNRYAYVMNNPMNFSDPSGLSAVGGKGMGNTEEVWYEGREGGNKNPKGKDPLKEFQKNDRPDISKKLGKYLNGPCNLVAPNFADLQKQNPAAYDLLSRRFGASAEEKYNNLTPYFRSVFLFTVAGIVDAGVDLSQARFEGFYFGSDLKAPPFGVELSGISKAGLGNLELTTFGYRSPSNVKIGAVEATFESNGYVAFDIDLFNPNGNLLWHTVEVVGNSANQTTTDPKDVLKVLNSRGIRTGVTCRPR